MSTPSSPLPSPAGPADPMPAARTRTPAAYAGLVARGFAMGAADVVPGVSGGTMAFILGIYEELLLAISAFTRRETLRLILTLGWRDALRILPWRFLLALGTGIALAVLSLARFLEWALEAHPVRVWAFFFGLVLASVWVIGRQVRWRGTLVAAAASAAVIAWWIVGLVPTQTPDTPLLLVLSGALAICAMILPGISGSFILVLLGKYQTVLSAVNDRDLVTIGLVGIGAVVGLLSFARVVSWLFRTRHNATVAVITGLILGSLRKIWPWKETLEWTVDRHGVEVPLVQANVAPFGSPSDLAIAAGLAALGFGTVLLLEWQASRRTDGDPRGE